MIGIQTGQQRPAFDNRAALLQFVIVEINADYLTCLIANSDPANALGNYGSASIGVARPYMLRTTPFNGKSWNNISYSYTGLQARTADNGNTENQVIVPAYVVSDIIYAMPVYNGALTLNYGGQSQSFIKYVDMNLDARAWAKEAS